MNIIKNKQNCKTHFFVGFVTCVGFIKISARVPFFNSLPVLQITRCNVVPGSSCLQLFTESKMNSSKEKKNNFPLHILKPCFSFFIYLFFFYIHTCPIQPNRYDSSTVVDESTHQKSNRALTYQKWRLVSNFRK